MKTYKPTSEGQRSRISADFDKLLDQNLKKSLLAPMKQKLAEILAGLQLDIEAGDIKKDIE